MNQSTSILILGFELGPTPSTRESEQIFSSHPSDEGLCERFFFFTRRMPKIGIGIHRQAKPYLQNFYLPHNSTILPRLYVSRNHDDPRPSSIAGCFLCSALHRLTSYSQSPPTTRLVSNYCFFLSHFRLRPTRWLPTHFAPACGSESMEIAPLTPIYKVMHKRRRQDLIRPDCNAEISRRETR